MTMMNFAKFMVFMAELAKIMYPWDQQRVKCFLEYLWPDNAEKMKAMHIDEHVKKLLDENIWLAVG